MDPEIRVEVLGLPADGGVRCLTVGLPVHATVADALRAATRDAAFAVFVRERIGITRFGRPVTDATALHEGDRLEILAPLPSDPRERRRARASSRVSRGRVALQGSRPGRR